ncbi:MAG: histidinol dehydrogenase [Acidobacteria bacterium]|nr:histidinol dehydrogenase [Acidobacteriota bacterium]
MKVYHVKDEKGRRLLARLERRRGLLLSDQTFTKARTVISEIRKRGDRALLKHIRALDLEGLAGDEIRLTGMPTSGEEELSDDLRRALDASIDAVTRFHREQVSEGYTQENDGTLLSLRLRPVPSAGIVLPSRYHVDLTSLIMLAVPARLAGVERVAVAVPARAYLGSPTLRYLLERLEADDVYLMSGVHAVAALAYGTDSIDPVDFIVGGGDPLLLAAKYLVAHRVAVDSRGGLPEIVIIADTSAEPELVTSDLLAQLEHDRDALGLVLTTSQRIAKRVNGGVTTQLRKLAKGHPAREAVKNWGGVLVVDSGAEACAVANRLAPSRVELLVGTPHALVDRLTTPALVTLGPWSPPALADAVSGASHVLPTLGGAVARGPLTVWDFYRSTCVVEVAAHHYPKMAQEARALAEAEQLPLHAASLTSGSRGER